MACWLLPKMSLELKDFFFPLLFCELVCENVDELNAHSKFLLYVQNFQIYVDVHGKLGKWKNRHFDVSR
jgi:hypothetical protein